MIKAGLYIHIPFCLTKCSYCDFYSIADQNDAIPRFIKSLLKEIDACQIDTSKWIFDTLFIGGGTPSLLDPLFIEQILTALQKKVDISQLEEITIEANPGEAPLERLKDFRSLGINRISMGVQSLDETLLKFLTRIHSVDAVFETFKNAKTAGFDNINCDLIYAIPGQTRETWERDLKQVVDLSPKHISAYTLTLEKGTGLFKLVKDKKVTMPENDLAGEWFLRTHELMEKNGYPAYEISNFSQPGFACEHNLHYWNIDPYLSFGPSAHSFDGKNRWSNIRHLDGYMDKIETGKSPVTFSESLNQNQLLNEKIGFGLRMIQGISQDYVEKESLEKTIKKWSDCINIENDMIRLTKKGLVFADAIGVDLMS
ncbi:MAG: radical SAM family heme chaperone HemW [Candidatus Marinimicrobia bacterium]|jgi:oxygen-independent coproporphyrinogen-3 oxidase|nr:radical SAM family heme chaperone HemW [Candidatus Neomarinimicrobiota bacterium]MBT3497222.1 radical SAM family heme chaperone HemW [Candidatus Neomarinimicrobiota bacterium]MBT3692481.1 radical SAM family heme chaperone HemW [Candidatus Neomarinimicrobiota bacterium]MBT3732724.1 radical SAM family heme chaperone HemW [Candidatus Neomarinimicrobiota bacterium]MBT4145062.1 radical SAM family heme chaperone HemW [Candidatus Neomarinimicrobiota bacterium]